LVLTKYSDPPKDPTQDLEPRHLKTECPLPHFLFLIPYFLFLILPFSIIASPEIYAETLCSLN